MGFQYSNVGIVPPPTPTFYLWKGWFGIPDQNKTPPEVEKGKYVRQTNMLTLFPYIDQVSARFGKISNNVKICFSKSPLIYVVVGFLKSVMQQTDVSELTSQTFPWMQGFCKFGPQVNSSHL